jgi:hypothetical protein
MIKSGSMTVFDWRLMYHVFRSNFKKHDHYKNLKHTPLKKKKLEIKKKKIVQLLKNHCQVELVIEDLLCFEKVLGKLPTSKTLSNILQ